MSRTEKYLWFLAAVLLLLFPLSFVIQNRKSSLKTTKTALLNPKYENEIKEIDIRQDEIEIRLFYNNGIWTCHWDSFIFPADQNSVSRLIGTLKKIRKLEEISRQNDFFQDSQATEFSYCLENGTTSSFFAGKTDLSETKISLKTGKKDKIYYTENDISQFKNLSPSFWIEPELIPLHTDYSLDIISKISFVENGIRRNLIPGSENFDEKLKTLLSLRHGKIETSDISKEYARLELLTSEDKKILLIFSELDDQTYLVTCRNSDFNYSVSISSWTYGKLKELFNQTK